MNKGHLKDTHKRLGGSHSKEYIYVARMGEVYMFIEVKGSDNLDFFTDPPDGNVSDGYKFTVDTKSKAPNDREGQSRLSALGQSTRYAHAVLTRQFRTCVYSVSVAGTTARLLRWDRSGLIVTKSFDYKENPSYLASFIWRFSKSTNERRGWDLSAKPVDSESERSQFTAAIKRNVQEQMPGLDDETAQKEADRHYWPGAIRRLTIGAHTFLVSRPIFTSKCLTGRSTTGYWGVDCKSGEVVFVKDIWRTGAQGAETEGAILEELLQAGVRNIPELVCHGYVAQGGANISVYCGFRGLISCRRGYPGHANRRICKRGMGSKLAPNGQTSQTNPAHSLSAGYEGCGLHIVRSSGVTRAVECNLRRSHRHAIYLQSY